MEAKKFLEQIKKLDCLIENKQIEAYQWKTLAMSTTAKTDGERVQSAGSQQKMADAVSKYVDLEREVNEAIDKLVDAKKDVIEVIEQLNPAEYDVLHKMYIQHIAMENVAIIKGKSYAWVKRMHKRALCHVQEILDEREAV